MKYLVDTDWVIDHLKGEEETVNKLEELAPEGVAMSVISLAEVYEGVYWAKDPAASQGLLEKFLASDLKLLDVDHEISKVFGKERGRMRKEGKMISDFDLMIAATCLHHDLDLLTNNRKHFGMVEGLRMISIS